jgi:hypothetical protein
MWMACSWKHLTTLDPTAWRRNKPIWPHISIETCCLLRIGRPPTSSIRKSPNCVGRPTTDHDGKMDQLCWGDGDQTWSPRAASEASRAWHQRCCTSNGTGGVLHVHRNLAASGGCCCCDGVGSGLECLTRRAVCVEEDMLRPELEYHISGRDMRSGGAGGQAAADRTWNRIVCTSLRWDRRGFYMCISKSTAGAGGG